MSSAICNVLRGRKAGLRWQKLVGYNTIELMKHLESKFDKNMNWGNHGSYWHIDHIKPKSLFHYTSPKEKEFKRCWSLGNLQPLEL